MVPESVPAGESLATGAFLGFLGVVGVEDREYDWLSPPRLILIFFIVLDAIGVDSLSVESFPEIIELEFCYPM